MQTNPENAVLFDERQLGPYPDHLLKRTDSPTVAIPGPIQRRSQTENAAVRVRRGDCGAEAAEKAAGFLYRYPLGLAIGEVRSRMMSTAMPTGGNPSASPPDGRALPKFEIPEDPLALSRNIKALGYFLGADAAGICEVPSWGYYIDDGEGRPNRKEWRNAIVFLKRNDPTTTLATNGRDWIVDATAQRTYLHLTMITEIVTSYIRILGGEAESDNLRNNKTMMPSLIIAAGLGEASRMGIALNPFFGADFKASAVLTDMPLLPDKPIDFGLQEYCGRCGICARHCVGNALSHGEKQMYNGYEKWIVDADRCFYSTALLEGGTNCFVCIMMCPWTRPNTLPGDFESWDGSVETLIAAVDARAAELRNNGFVRQDAPGSKWWLGLSDKPEFKDIY